jgi:hypothetical protein
VEAKSARSADSKSILFRLRLPKVIRELELAVRDASDAGWKEPERKRAHEIAVALSDFLRQEGLRDSAILARSLSSLMGLSRDQILPVEEALREKASEILDSLNESARRVLASSGS